MRKKKSYGALSSLGHDANELRKAHTHAQLISQSAGACNQSNTSFTNNTNPPPKQFHWRDTK